MKITKKWYFYKKIQEKKKQLWDREFTKKFLGEQREGIRIEYDRLNEQLDAAKRRLCAEKYELVYSESGDKVEIRNAPISADEIEGLDTKKSEKSRFHKIVKEDPDKTIVTNLEEKIKQLSPDVEQLKTQMQQLTQRIEGPLTDENGVDHSLNGSSSDLRTVIDLLRNHMKSL